LEKIDVRQRVRPIRACTRSEEKPRGGAGSSWISADSSSGTVAKNQASVRAAHRHTSLSNSIRTGPA
jgi:hypothetical protein